MVWEYGEGVVVVMSGILMFCWRVVLSNVTTADVPTFSRRDR